MYGQGWYEGVAVAFCGFLKGSFGAGSVERVSLDDDEPNESDHAIPARVRSGGKEETP